MSAELVVGFDLDMTLVDTRAGFAATLVALGAELGVELPVGDLVAKLGPPLEQMLQPHLAAEAVGPAGDRFRALYPDHAVAATPAFDGVVEALAAVRREQGRIVLITGKYPPNARLHVEHLGLDVDHVEGWVWGAGKAVAMREHGVGVYVGDHVHDVEGARAAGVVSVSVLTGGCSADELLEAGTDVVLNDLSEFPAWLSGHLRSSRLAALEAELRSHGRVLVAFSGGADSAFLLAAAVRFLGADNVIAATGYSSALPLSEREPALSFAGSLGVEVLTPVTHELDRAGYRDNSGDRCAFCKTELLDVLSPLAAERGAVVATGTNADDARAGFRPGIGAAATLGAVTPLLDAGLTKEQVRAISREWGLPTWDKPAAACLSSRIAYGVQITDARLARVERAEAAVRELVSGVRDLRVRDLGTSARIELDGPSLASLSDAHRAQVCAAVRDAGFDEAWIDARGFRSGSMNELLPDPAKYRG